MDRLSPYSLAYVRVRVRFNHGTDLDPIYRSAFFGFGNDTALKYILSY